MLKVYYEILGKNAVYGCVCACFLPNMYGYLNIGYLSANLYMVNNAQLRQCPTR